MDINGKELKNSLSEDYCSFEVSKLLKEKGFWIDWRIFNGKTFSYYPNHGDGAGWYEDASEASTETIQRPTHSLAIKWIRENFRIHIITQQVWYNKNTEIAYFYMICETPEKEYDDHQDRFSLVLDGSHQEVKGKYINDEKFDKLIFETGFAFKTPEEATEAALLYTLKHLIK